MKIEGSVSSLNYILVPNPKFDKPFAYIGKNYYIFFKAFNDKKFYFKLFFHLNKNNKIRFIFKYPLKKIKITRTDAFNVEIPININEEKDSSWILYKFSPIEYIKKNLVKYKVFSGLKNLPEDKCIFKYFEICSTIHIRGIFITDKNIEINKLPKEISLSSAGEKNDLNMYYVDLVENKEIKNNTDKSSQNNLQNDINMEDNNNINYKTKNEINKRSSINSINSIDKSSINMNNKIYKEEENQKVNNSIISNLTYFSKLQKNNTNTSKISKKLTQTRIPLYPDPILSLNYIIGYTSKNCPSVKYNSYGDYDISSPINIETRINQTKKYFYYCSGSNIIKYDPYTKSQKFFMGHSKSISNFIIACKGEIIFSGEEGSNSIIRIWKVEDLSCIKMFTTPLDKLKSLSESLSSKYLCVSGKEQIKELIIIFKIENLNDIVLFSKKNVNFNINCIKFVPYSDEILMSCGYENIKFFRMKNNNLYEKSVVLSQYAKKNNFLCLDFNRAILGDNYTDKGKAFIGSSLGHILEISCQSQELESVYLIENSPILSICANESFVVTGSGEGNCRVWPVGFEEFIMEAKHDSGVCSVDISYDSMEILIGTLNGSIGNLEIKDKKYNTLIRSPNGDIKILVVHPLNNFIFTVENLGNLDILKIWDLMNKNEIFEFKVEGDLISCVNSDNSNHFVVGFNSGIIKIFNFEKNELIYQSKPFKTPIDNIIFVQNYTKFISMSNLGNLSIHDCTQNFIQIKVINLEKECLYPDISLSIDQNYFAVNGAESKYINIRNSDSIDLKSNINLISKISKKICLINKNLIGTALSDNSIRFYSLAKYEGIFIKEIKDVHIKDINRFICSKNYNYFLTSGEEGLIKIWDMKSVFNNYKSYQQYIGHSNGVNGLVLVNSKGIVLSTGKNNGLYFWNFLGNITTYNDEIIKALDKLDDPLYIDNLKYKLDKNFAKSSKRFNINNEEEKKGKILTEDIRTLHMQKQYNAENQDKQNIYYKLEQNDKIENVEIEKIKEKEDEIALDEGFKVLPKYPVKDIPEKVVINKISNDLLINNELLFKYEKSNINMKEKLLFSSNNTPSSNNNDDPQISKEETEDNYGINNRGLDYMFCIGLSINSMNNLIFNKENNWFAFIVNNKIIIEYLKGERRQKIINDSMDEISCIILSNDLKYLIAGIGKKNKEKFARIYIYDTENYSKIKTLNLNPKGIQHIALSNDNKYMISLGTKEENSLCVWDFTNFKLIDMRTVKYNYFSSIIENDINKLKFITCSFYAITFWELNDENKLENIDITLEEILINANYEKDEFITGINLYEYKNEFNINESSNYIILLTNKGNVLILDNIKKTLIKKYLICKYPLTKIFYSKSYFILAGEGPLLYIWNLPKMNESLDLLDILESNNPFLIPFDSSINSISYLSANDECIISTGKKEIFYVNLNEKSSIKISSSHYDSDIIKIYTDINDTNIYTLGKEEYIRCWTNDSFDGKYLITKRNQKPDNMIYNYKNNILITQYENSYLTAFNTKELKSLGKIYIPNEDISQFCYIFDNNNILLITFQIKIYIISIKNYKPLSMLYYLINIPKTCKSFPYEQKCTFIACSNITTEISYSSFSFSDGTTCIYKIQRINGKIVYDLLDNFNLILLHSREYNDENSQELYYNLINFRSDYRAESLFSKKNNDIIICYHESLKAILVRNFIKKMNLKIINLSYFPYCINISNNGKYMAIGTKDGYIAIIDENKFYKSDYCPIFNNLHFDKVLCIRFSHDSKRIFSSSKNEIIISNIEK